MEYDFLIVGAGLFGSTFARTVAEKGKKVLIVEKRKHIGGNCYTEKIEGINVHKYGAHIFHTNDEKIWNFINRFSKFIEYNHKVKVNFKNKVYSFPINLMTLNQIWGIKTPEEARLKLASVSKESQTKNNLEEHAISMMGKELYEIFIKGYTSKQWNKDPKELPASIIKRIP
ncbi:MAG: FAD-dependent oxidoreductase, partial [Chlamydiae bacterium]|nr:FAD-dependent oxidoreductase [Chlamydiota bacterium]